MSDYLYNTNPEFLLRYVQENKAKEQAECPLDATACSALVEVAANAMKTRVRDAHVIRINDGPWLDFEATHQLGKSLGFGGYLNLLEWLVEKYGAPFKGVVHWPNDTILPPATGGSTKVNDDEKR